MKVFAAMLSAILGAAGIFVLIYQNHETGARRALKKAMTKSDSMSWIYSNTNWKRGTPTPAPFPKAPEMNLAQAVTIKTPDGELTIPKGARVRVIEQAKSGMVAINYQGYTAPIPENAISR